jgi:hypothetical protein
MKLQIAVFLGCVGLFFAVLVLELVRRKRLRPEYALLWGALALATLLLAVFPQAVEWLVRLTGMEYRSTVIVLIFIFTAIMLINFTVIISRQGQRIVRLTQEVALLQLQVEQMKKVKGDAGAEKSAK